MITTHTANWRLSDVPMTCGHTLSVRDGASSTWCPWCARTVHSTYALAA